MHVHCTVQYMIFRSIRDRLGFYAEIQTILYSWDSVQCACSIIRTYFLSIYRTVPSNHEAMAKIDSFTHSRPSVNDMLPLSYPFQLFSLN